MLNAASIGVISEADESRIIFKDIKNSNSNIRDQLLFIYLNRNYKFIDFDNVYYETVKIIKNVNYIKLLKKFKNRLSGNFMIPFSVPNQKGEKIELSSYRNKVCVIDMWFTGCGACTSFYQNVLSNVENYFDKDTNLIFISISADKNKEVWIKSIGSKQYTSEKSLNLFTDAKGFDHPLLELLKVTSFPTVILVDKKGKISQFNSYKLYTYDSLISSINNLLILPDN
jgi:peroxiredoxin